MLQHFSRLYHAQHISGVHFKQLGTQQQFVSSFFYSVLETCSQLVLHRKAFHTTDFLFVCKRKALYRTYFQCVRTRKAFYTTLFRVVLNRKTSYTTDFWTPNFCIKSKNILYKPFFPIFSLYNMFFVPNSSIFYDQKFQVGHQ